MGSVDGKYIRWQVKVNFYEVALTEIQMLLQQVNREIFFYLARKNETC
jgi:hypothetical protein